MKETVNSRLEVDSLWLLVTTYHMHCTMGVCTPLIWTVRNDSQRSDIFVCPARCNLARPVYCKTSSYSWQFLTFLPYKVFSWLAIFKSPFVSVKVQCINNSLMVQIDGIPNLIIFFRTTHDLWSFSIMCLAQAGRSISFDPALPRPAGSKIFGPALTRSTRLITNGTTSKAEVLARPS